MTALGRWEDSISGHKNLLYYILLALKHRCYKDKHGIQEALMLQTFTISAKALSWNKLCTAHWRVYSRLANEWKYLALEAIQKAKIKPCTVFPIEVSIHCKWKAKRVHDIDSLYCKAICDQLVASKIIPDDSLEYIDRVAFSGETGCKKDEVIVTLTSS